MMKKILTFIVMLTALFGTSHAAEQSLSAGQWRITNTFDNHLHKLVDGPERTYALALGHIYYATEPSWAEYMGQLMVYDKKTGEFEGYNASNYLRGNMVRNFFYNRDKRYLLIVYTDYSIDLLYDDDTLVSIPALASSSMTSSKNINAVSFDPANDRVYLATDFGYFVIDDKKNVITESRMYGKALTGMCRTGDNIYVSTSDGVYVSPVSDRRAEFNSFKKVESLPDAITNLLPLTDTTFAAIRNVNPDAGVYIATVSDEGVTATNVCARIITMASENRDGYYLEDNSQAIQLNKDGSIAKLTIPSARNGSHHGSWDMQTLQVLVARVGIESYTRQESEWSDAQVIPTVFPQVFQAFTIDKNDTYGMVVSHNTLNRIHTTTWMNYAWRVSTYKDGEWKAVGPTVAGNAILSSAANAYGAVYDPVIEHYIYGGTRSSGLFRVDLRDNKGKQYASTGQGNASKADFHIVFPRSSYSPYCDVSLPSFDKNGTLWVVHNPSLVSDIPGPVYYWKAEDRKTDNVSGFKPLKIKDFKKADNDQMTVVALRHSLNDTKLLVFYNYNIFTGLHLIDHKGTLEDTSDDTYTYITAFEDQDGSRVPATYINCAYEDPQTGRVWVGTSTSMFSFMPSDVTPGSSTARVHRAKIARNDGTNLAGYLLDGSDVFDITRDAAGRMWFATNGGGIIVTSADGSQVLENFTTDSSLIPSNEVYKIFPDPDSNEVWIGSSHQISTYYSDASPAQPDFNTVAVYPNPVRPDYLGDVTIDGLMDDTLVKIVDASGSLIKELGRSTGGRISWDLTNTGGARATTGVYYVMASTASGEKTEGYVGKILVVR